MTKRSILSLTPAALLLTFAVSLPAANLTWDPSATGTGSDGSGTWTSSSAIFSNGSSDVAVPAYITANTTAATTSGTNTITVSTANAALLTVGQGVSSASFPTGTTITAINTGTGVLTMSVNSTAGITSGTGLAFASPDTLIFGKGTGAAGTVTVSSNQGANAMTLNAPGSGTYSFTGGTITLGSNNGATGTLTVNESASIGSAFNWRNINFATTGKTLTLSGGSTSGNLVSAFNGNVSGSSTAIAAASSLQITAGTYTTGGAGNTINIGNTGAATGGLQMSSGTITTGGNFQFGNAGSGFGNQTGGAVNSTGQVTVGRGSATNVGRFVLNGGTFTSTSNHAAPFGIGRAGGVGTFDVNSGTLDILGTGTGNATTAVGGVLVLGFADSAAGAGGTATMNINGGTTTAKEIRFNTANNNNEGNAISGSGTLNVNGGNLYVGGTVTRGASGSYTTGAGGMQNYGTGTSTYAINLTGGLVGATADWSSGLNMTLTNANGGVTFKTASAANVSRDITLSGNLSGTGGFSKTGGGTLTLTGTNGYSGATSINAGTFVVGGSGSINSTSGITLASGTVFKYNSSVTYSGGAITNNGGKIGGSGNLGTIVLGGTGSVDPGNSPGIMTAGSTNPTSGLDYNFEFTLANTAPNWNNATASGNDVLRLTDASTPFAVALNNGNTVSIYLNVASLTASDIFTGGFFTDKNASFLSDISAADFKFYLMNAGGAVNYNGVNYDLYSGPLGFTMNTVAQSANFASGTVNGYSMQFTAVPEPTGLGMFALGLLGLVLVQRRRNRTQIPGL